MTNSSNPLDLSGPAREALDSLSPEHRRRLLKLMASAETAQRRSLEQAVEGALAIVPAPFRKRLRRMVMR